MNILAHLSLSSRMASAKSTDRNLPQKNIIARYGLDMTADRIDQQAALVGAPFFDVIRLMPIGHRQAMNALRAFCRELHDIAQSERPVLLKQALLSQRRCEIARVFAGQPGVTVTHRLAGSIRRYRLRCEDFLALVEHAEMEARTAMRAPSGAELDLYCRRGAVSVARLAMQIFGLRSAPAEKAAVELGRALQLTAILRNLAEDAERHRLYLPRDLLRKHGIFARIPGAVLTHPALPRVCDELVATAEAQFAAAESVLDQCPPYNARAAALVLRLQRMVLQALTERGWRRLGEPVSVLGWQEALLIARFGLIGR